VARNSRTMLNMSGESGHPCVIPDFRGNGFSFSPLSMMLAIGLPYISFIMLRMLIFLVFLEFYNEMVLNLIKSIRFWTLIFWETIAASISLCIMDLLRWLISSWFSLMVISI
jgi:hypothetical protein